MKWTGLWFRALFLALLFCGCAKRSMDTNVKQNAEKAFEKLDQEKEGYGR